MAIPLCLEEDIQAAGCNEYDDCEFPDPEVCNWYVSCRWFPGEKTWKPERIPCPSDLEWNNKDKKCDLVQRSTCPNKPTPPTL
ncbi:unnamed protein product [Cunninghamella echinulata]